MYFLVFLVGTEEFLLPVNGLPKRARFLAILGLIFLTLINVGLEFLEGDGASKLKASLGSFLSSWSFIFWNGWKASIVPAWFLGSSSSTLESWIKRHHSRCMNSDWSIYSYFQNLPLERRFPTWELVGIEKGCLSWALFLVLVFLVSYCCI